MQRRKVALALLLLAPALTACAGPPSETPAKASRTSVRPGTSAGMAAWTTPNASGGTWETSTVEQPPGFDQPYASAPAPGFCSPCHTGGASMDAVAAWAHGLVAVGSTFPDTRAAAWTSSDGRSWSLAPGFAASSATLLTGVATSGGTIVAVGGDGREPAVWVSIGGSSWREIRPMDEQREARMTAITALPGRGFVAVGYADGPGPIGAAAWTSSDGIRWRAAPTPANFRGARLLAVAVARGGRLVAVGEMGTSGATRPAAWTSSDGEQWSAATVTAETSAASMDGVTAGSSGLVAVGYARDQTRAAVWTSPDGLHWTRLPDNPAFANYGQRISIASVARASSGSLVAVGGRDSVGNGSPVVWTSADGTAWQRVPDPPSFSGGEMTAVAPWGPGYVAVGSLGWPDNWYAAAWISPG